MSSIPIANIYYLLCYAWDVLKEDREAIPVGSLDFTNMRELFAHVLINGTRAAIRRGLDRGYQSRQEEIAGIRGRLLLAQTYRRNLPAHARVACEWDELEYGTLPNRILKSTLCELRTSGDLPRTMSDEIHELLRWFAPVQTVRLKPHHFQRVQLHGNNRHYKLLLHVCEFIHEQSFPTPGEQNGKRRFRDFARDDLPKLFEKFVLNFYRRELPPGWEVDAPRIKWDCEPDSMNEHALRHLPDMRTDICLRNRAENRATIMDTKYYTSALKTGRYRTERLSSGNLYQIFTYLRQRSCEPGWEKADGILLYPKNEYNLDATFATHGHRMRAVTIDLTQPWQTIAANLRRIVEVAGDGCAEKNGMAF